MWAERVSKAEETRKEWISSDNDYAGDTAHPTHMHTLQGHASVCVTVHCESVSPFSTQALIRTDLIEFISGCNLPQLWFNT